MLAHIEETGRTTMYTLVHLYNVHTEHNQKAEESGKKVPTYNQNRDLLRSEIDAA